MPNTDQTPISSAQDTTTFNGQEVKIVAESFNEPIKQVSGLMLFSRLKFIAGTIELNQKTRFYEPVFNEDELKETVNYAKENLDIFLSDMGKKP